MFPVDAFQNTLGKFITLLNPYSIRFHLTGGFTSMVYGEPRMTQDIDLVIDNQAIKPVLEPFLARLETSDFLYHPSQVRAAIHEKSMFQLLDKIETLKLDIYPRELIQGELSRSVWVEVFQGINLPVASKIDAAASKLIWISRGSHKNRKDLRIIFRFGSDEEKRAITKLAHEIGLETLLKQVLEEPDELVG